MIELDGSFGEGGGQIVRTALALSAFTGEPFAVTGIRKGREKPGLKAQHLTSLEALAKLTSAEVKGAKLGALELVFKPGRLAPRDLTMDVGTAGSVTLLMQSLVLPCLFLGAPVSVRLIGGTDTKWAMPIDYFASVFAPTVVRFGEIRVEVVRRGYYPKGGGEATFSFTPRLEVDGTLGDARKRLLGAGVAPMDFTEPGRLVEIRGVSHCSGDLFARKVADRQADAAKHTLQRIGVPVDIRAEYSPTFSTGTGITVWAMVERGGVVTPGVAADGLGERSVKAEDVGRIAAERLGRLIEARVPVDVFMADNLVPFAALVGGKVACEEISEHVRSNIYVVEKFLPARFAVDGKTRTYSV